MCSDSTNEEDETHFYLFLKLYAVIVQLLWDKFHYTFSFPSFPLLYFLHTPQLQMVQGLYWKEARIRETPL